MTTDPNCLFCKIVAKSIPAQIVYEDDHTLAFLDITPHAPGHTMVIPKYHASRLVELPDVEVASLFAAVKKVAKLLDDKLGADGVTIGINQGRASGQEVDHLHVHIMPRWKGDKGNAVQSLVNNPPKGSLEEMRKKIGG
jgi:histidine triad (HIT) family protein